MITKTTYETYKDNYNKRSTGDRQDQDLLDAVEIHGSNITDLKKLLAWNDPKTTTVIQSWKKQIKDNAAFYKGDLQKLQIDWEKFLLKHSLQHLIFFVFGIFIIYNGNCYLMCSIFKKNI